MINDKDIRPGSVFEGLVDHQKIVVEKVIDNHDGIKYVMFRDEKVINIKFHMKCSKDAILKRW